MYDWAKKLPSKQEFLTSVILYEYLQIGYQIDKYNFDLFEEYLKFPLTYNNLTNDPYYKKITARKNTQDFWYS